MKNLVKILLFFIASPAFTQNESYKDYAECLAGLNAQTESHIARPLNTIKGSGPIANQKFNAVVGVLPDEIIIMRPDGATAIDAKAESFVVSDTWSEKCSMAKGSETSCKEIPLALSVKRDEMGPGYRFNVTLDAERIKSMSADPGFRVLSETEHVVAATTLLRTQVQILDTKLSAQKKSQPNALNFQEINSTLTKCRRFLKETQGRIAGIDKTETTDPVAAHTATTSALEQLDKLKIQTSFDPSASVKVPAPEASKVKAKK